MAAWRRLGYRNETDLSDFLNATAYTLQHPNALPPLRLPRQAEYM